MTDEKYIGSIDVSAGEPSQNGSSDPVFLEYAFAGGGHSPPQFVHAGTLAWIALHTYSGCEEQWLLEWEKTIPSAGCGCHAGYLSLKEEVPPDFSSPDAFFAWGVALHNSVNRKLGKQELSLEEAQLLWRSKYGMEDQEDRH